MKFISAVCLWALTAMGPSQVMAFDQDEQLPLNFTYHSVITAPNFPFGAVARGLDTIATLESRATCSSGTSRSTALPSAEPPPIVPANEIQHRILQYHRVLCNECHLRESTRPPPPTSIWNIP